MGKRPPVKVKRLFYRRATWTNQEKDTLESTLKICHENFKTTSQRTFKGLYGSEIQCARYLPKDKVGLFFQIASYVPGQSTTAIEESSATSEKSDISEVVAPKGNNFLDGDIFLLVNRNNVILLQSGVRENVALNYMCQMLEKNAFKHALMSLEFLGIAKEDKVEMIQTQGVKAIELNASLYEASLMHLEKQNEKAQRETKVFDLPGIVADSLKQVFAKDKNLKEITEKENVNIKLSITFDGREAKKKKNKKDGGFGELGRSRLQKTSEMIVKECLEEDLDGFTIITGDNNKIKSDEIVVSDNYRVKTFGKSLDQSDAFEKIEEYYFQLEHRGILTR